MLRYLENERPVLAERLTARLFSWIAGSRAALSAGLLSGFLAFSFAFCNKLLNADEIAALFSKGTTIPSGRWALQFTSLLFPNVSMPWLYGVLSVLLLSVAAAVAVRVLRLKSRLLQVLLAAVIVCFPAETGTLCYMYTSAPYALAFLLAVLAVWAVARSWPERFPRWQDLLLGLVCLVFSLGIYQAYVAVASSLLLILLMRSLLERSNSASRVFRFALVCAGFLAASLLVYLVAASLALRISQMGLNSYGFTSYSLLYRLRLAYTAFAGIFLKGRFAYIRPGLSLAVHWFCLLLTAAAFLSWCVRERNAAKIALLLLFTALLPLSVCCFYLVSSPAIIHSLVIYSFVALYALAASLAESLSFSWHRLYKNGVCLTLALVAVCNIAFANKVFTKMYLQYENAYAFYSGLVTRLQMSEDLEEGSQVALVGNSETVPSFMGEELDVGELGGPNLDLINIYTKHLFIQEYLGFDIRFVHWTKEEALAQDPRVQAMPYYPRPGSIQTIDGIVVVRLGNYE